LFDRSRPYTRNLIDDGNGKVSPCWAFSFEWWWCCLTSRRFLLFFCYVVLPCGVFCIVLIVIAATVYIPNVDSFLLPTCYPTAVFRSSMSLLLVWSSLRYCLFPIVRIWSFVVIVYSSIWWSWLGPKKDTGKITALPWAKTKTFKTFPTALLTHCILIAVTYLILVQSMTTQGHTVLWRYLMGTCKRLCTSTQPP
jgi:hypothetical protein